MSIFGLEKIINIKSPHEKLNIYYAGFDFSEYRYDELVEQILDVLVYFSYGFHKGILEDNLIFKGYTTIYKVEENHIRILEIFKCVEKIGSVRNFVSV